MPSDDDPIFKSRKKADAKNRKDNHQMSHQFSSLENLNDILKKNCWATSFHITANNVTNGPLFCQLAK